jgi:D-glycero-alpha-D-manno-heptose 1-phosphate guanylyltransferase
MIKKNKKAVILAGGFGTRLKSVLKDKPKPMVDVHGKPFLEYQLQELKKAEFLDIILCIGFKSEVISSYFKSGDQLGISLEYSEEKNPLGTAGAIKNAEDLVSNPFLVINGDTFIEMDFQKFFELHNQKKSMFSVALASNNNQTDCGSVRIDKDGRIIDFQENFSLKGNYLVNMGVYIINPLILKYIPKNKKYSLEKELIPDLISKGIECFGFCFKNQFMDIGTPDRLELFKKRKVRGEL